MERVYKCLETITGLSQEDFKGYQDVDLMKEGILDSLCLLELMSLLSKEFNKKITASQFSLEDFSNVNVFIQKILSL